MSGISLSFNDAVAALAAKTYMSEDDAATLLKFEIHKPKFMKTIGRKPTMDEAEQMMAFCRRDKALAYLEYQFPNSMILAIIEKTLKTYPINDGTIQK